jgi:DNA-binding HxlR family transcriptional regulator
MPMGTDYDQQNCAIARSLEIVGERWTLLIVRDLFYGVRRFSDFRKHIGAPPAVLTDRLTGLVEAGVVARVPGRGSRDEYELTARGEALWPVIRSLSVWGNANFVTEDARRGYTHATCGTLLDADGACPPCGVIPPARDVVAEPRTAQTGSDPVSVAMQRAHRLLEPLAT